MDLRERVIQASQEEGLSARAAAQRFGVGVTTAIVWIRRFRQDGESTPRRQGAARGSKLDRHRTFILDLIEKRKDITLTEIADCLESECHVRAGVTTLWRWLDRQGVTYKKNGTRCRTATPGCRRPPPGVV